MVVLGGGGLTNPYFLTKSFLRSADLSEGRWFQEARQQQRPLVRVGAAVCSQQYLISPWGKSGHLDIGVAGEARDLGCFRSGYGQAVNRFVRSWPPLIDKLVAIIKKLHSKDSNE